MNELPIYVVRALEHWDTYAPFAYQSFLKSGRGVVGVHFNEIGYLSEEMLQHPKMHITEEVLAILTEYQPETEILLVVKVETKRLCFRIGTPKGFKTPKDMYA